MIKIIKNNLEELAHGHFLSLMPIIQKRLANKRGKVFDFLKDNLEIILKGKPEVLEGDVANKIPPYNEQDKIAIQKIFNYISFKRASNYNASKLADNLQVNVCPYCNRQYTFTIIKKSPKKVITRPDFDHFFPQDAFPYLGLSFYNLVPSCKICNSLKHNNKWDLEKSIHPYIEGFKDCKFSLVPKKDMGIDFFYGRTEAFDIIFNNKTAKSETNITDLLLLRLYEEHKDYVSEILKRSVVYSDSYINQLYSQFEGTLFSNIGDVKRMITSNYPAEEDLGKRILSKLH
jgi:hypothetical protein